MLDSLSQSIPAVHASLRGSFSVSLAAFRRNLTSDAFALLFEALFLYGIYLLTFNVFTVVKGSPVPLPVLEIFFWGYVAIDLSGGLFFQAQIPAFVKSIKDQSVIFYQLSPGHPLLKLMMLRVSAPRFFAFLCAFVFVLWRVFLIDPSTVPTFALVLLLGVVMNALLELTFELSILNYDVNLYGAFQNPISRLISRPLNAVLSAGSLVLGIFKFAVPVYFVLGFPVEIATGYPTSGPVWISFLLLAVWMTILYFACTTLARNLMAKAW